MLHFTKRMFTVAGLLLAHALTAQTFSSETQPRFEENKGQWDQAVLYRTELNNGFIYHERGGYTVHFSNLSDAYEEFHHGGGDAADVQIKNDVIKVSFVGASSMVQTRAAGRNPVSRSYFTNNKLVNQTSDVGTFSELSYEQLYPGISLNYRSYRDIIKYDYIIAPGADASLIRLEYNGATKQEIDAEGNLVTSNSLGSIKEYAPVAYQETPSGRVNVLVQFMIQNGQVSYYSPNGYDSNYPLVIDLFLAASTYSGSTADNWGFTACPGPTE